MKKFILPAALFTALIMSADLKAQDPTTGKKNSTVITPEKKDSEVRKDREPGAKGTSEKISIGDEGDADDKKKSTTGTSTGTTTKSPTVKPNSSRNPK